MVSFEKEPLATPYIIRLILLPYEDDTAGDGNVYCTWQQYELSEVGERYDALEMSFIPSLVPQVYTFCNHELTGSC